jgi:catechol 2,3-dioxygenase-like lactoylglutathione lyase family enzyme
MLARSTSRSTINVFYLKTEVSMKRIFSPAVFAFFVLAGSADAVAQLLSNKEAPVRISHYHLNVTSVEAQKRFWVDALGGTAVKFGRDNLDMIKLPDVLIFLHVQKPTGVNRGTAFDHIGLAAPNVAAVVGKLKESGLYQPTVGREPVPGAPPPAEGQGGAGAVIAYLLGPDGVKLEIVTNREPNAPPLKGHHMHFINKQYVEMCQWYMKVFDAPCGRSQTDFFIGGDLPGVGYSLNFFRWEGDQSVTPAPTRGRVTDRVGFEVKNLQEFSRALEARGIKLTEPYRRMPGLNNIGAVMLTDPWGVSIELTEGLDQVQ